MPRKPLMRRKFQRHVVRALYRGAMTDPRRRKRGEIATLPSDSLA
jgi:hypothetical protein